MTDPSPDRDAWWHDAVGYEIYLRSFADSDGDGVGDLAGVAERLDHLVALGVDLVWITPFYPSPMVDFGYDVADYCGVDPTFGDLEAFDTVVSAAHARSMRVVIDIVPNHCSSRHRWFRQALADPDGQYRDYFIWREPRPDDALPNNWVSHFGGPAWTFDERSGQYYLHSFLPEQPDLNWANPAVRREFRDILRFWLGRGVDGFRVDVAQALTKDPELRDNPQLREWDPAASRWEQWDAFDHVYDVLQPDALGIYAEWRRIAAAHDAVLIGETYVTEPDQLAKLLPGDGLDVGFWFRPMHIDWAPEQIRAAIAGPIAAVEDPRRIGWVSASHDERRPPTRFGGGDLGRSRALAFATLLVGLPGVPFLYQGEELGLEEGIVLAAARVDPVSDDPAISRDGCRTPMPWEPGPAFGFSSTTDTWLPDGGRVDADTASVQRADPTSWFHRYRRLVQLRHDEPDLRSRAFEWLDFGHDAVVAFRRGRLVVAANAGDEPVALDLVGDLRYATHDRPLGACSAMTLAASEAVVVRDAADAL